MEVTKEMKGGQRVVIVMVENSEELKMGFGFIQCSELAGSVVQLFRGCHSRGLSSTVGQREV